MAVTTEDEQTCMPLKVFHVRGNGKRTFDSEDTCLVVDGCGRRQSVAQVALRHVDRHVRFSGGHAERMAVRVRMQVAGLINQIRMRLLQVTAGNLRRPPH